VAVYNYLITCAGWEERFLEGFRNNFDKNTINKVIIFSINEFQEKTSSNTLEIKKIVGEDNYHFIDLQLLDDVDTWRKIEALFNELAISDKSLCIDISTMPRFLIWFLMHFANNHKNNVEYVYFKPERYDTCEWLTSDAEPPRLIFKHSGVCLPDQPTILVIQTGFDIERVNQLIYTYEPEKVYLGAQTGEQFNNALNNLKRHKEQLQYQEIEYFEINAFDGDFGYKSMEKIVQSNKYTRNIILASLGPKPTSLAMFKLNEVYPEIGLTYVLVKNYNDCYSHGTNLTGLISVNYNDL
jgi:hypothetical protein